jgi:hypothetical protein
MFGALDVSRVVPAHDGVVANERDHRLNPPWIVELGQAALQRALYIAKSITAF